MPTLFQINAACNCGSTGRIVEQIGLLARTHGWSCFVAHSWRYRSKTELNSIQVCSSWEEKAHILYSTLFDGQGLGSYFGTKRLIRVMEDVKPDIVHLHNIHGYFINYPLLFRFLSRAGIPVVWTLHDCWTFTGHCVYFDKVGCSKWKHGCSECPQIKEYPRSMFDFSTRNFCYKQEYFPKVKNIIFVPVSSWLNNLLKESFLGGYPSVVIHNGIDLKKFKNTQNTFRKNNGLSNKFVILGVANGFGKRKGLDDFIKLKSLWDNSFVIVLIGLNENEMKSLPIGIIGKSRTKDQKELIDIYSSADVYLNPTYEDNFPTTNIESLACGTPVITYNTGGSPEAIDSQTGIVVTKGDLNGLIMAINKIKQNGKSYYSEACRERAEKYYDKNERFLEYMVLYNKILKKNNCKRNVQ